MEIEPCGEECLPLLQNCEAGEACIWIGDSWACQTGTDDLGRAEPCSEATECAPGLVCVEGARVPDCAGEHCCTELCDLHDDNGYCPGDAVCIDVFVGDDDEGGACLLPAIPDMPAFLCIEQTHERPRAR